MWLKGATFGDSRWSPYRHTSPHAIAVDLAADRGEFVDAGDGVGGSVHHLRDRVLVSHGLDDLVVAVSADGEFRELIHVVPCRTNHLVGLLAFAVSPGSSRKIP